MTNAETASAELKARPTLMRFEGGRYDDGSGPKITVEYHSAIFSSDSEPGIRIKTFSEDYTVVFATEIPWLIETLQRIERERRND